MLRRRAPLSAKKRKVRRSTMQRRRAATRIGRSVRRAGVRKQRQRKRRHSFVRKGGEYTFSALKKGNGMFQAFRPREFVLTQNTTGTGNLNLKYLQGDELKGQFNFRRENIIENNSYNTVNISATDPGNRTYVIKFKSPEGLKTFLQKVDIHSQPVPSNNQSAATISPQQQPVPGNNQSPATINQSPATISPQQQPVPSNNQSASTTSPQSPATISPQQQPVPSNNQSASTTSPQQQPPSPQQQLVRTARDEDPEFWQMLDEYR